MRDLKVKNTNRSKGNRRDQIVQAAAKLFKEFGFNGTSIEDIAREVNLPKGGIYNHIRSKEELLYEIITYGILHFLPTLREIKTSRDEIETNFRRAVFANVYSIATQWISVSSQDRMGLSRQHYLKYRSYRDEVEQIFKDLIKQGIKEGVFRKTDVSLCTYAVLGMCNSITVWYRPDGRLSPEKIAEFFADAAFNIVRR